MEFRCCGQFGAAGLGTFPCQDHCLFNTTADPSETVDLSNKTELSGLLYDMLTRYAELSKQGILDLGLSLTYPPGVTPPLHLSGSMSFEKTMAAAC